MTPPSPSAGAPAGSKRSAELFERACELMPGGVNSPVRAFRGVGGTPRFIREGRGSRMFDADGNELIDYVGSWGPLILGHAHPAIVAALREAVGRGTSFGAPTELEIQMAETVRSMMPSIEMVRMVNSGTEAALSAVRLARGATGRPKIIKMDGCYHGHVDSLLAKAGSGVATLGLPDSPGVTPGMAGDTLTVPYNDAAAVDAILQQNAGEVAAVILEPIAGNMGLVVPKPGYLQSLKAIAAKHGALLIFDEVMTGFRVHPGGAQGLYGVMPDLTIFGKVIGGGLPVGAYGGREDLMAQIAPSGPIYQAGTLSGNPLAMTAGILTLKILRDTPGFYDQLEQRSAQLAEGLGAAMKTRGIPVSTNRVGSMMTLFFQEGPITNYADAKKSDTARYGKWFHAMLNAGHYFAPSQYECAFVSAAHTKEDIAATIESAKDAFLQA